MGWRVASHGGERRGRAGENPPLLSISLRFSVSHPRSFFNPRLYSTFLRPRTECPDMLVGPVQRDGAQMDLAQFNFGGIVGEWKGLPHGILAVKGIWNSSLIPRFLVLFLFRLRFCETLQHPAGSSDHWGSPRKSNYASKFSVFLILPNYLVEMCKSPKSAFFENRQKSFGKVRCSISTWPVWLYIITNTDSGRLKIILLSTVS